MVCLPAFAILVSASLAAVQGERIMQDPADEEATVWDRVGQFDDLMSQEGSSETLMPIDDSKEFEDVAREDDETIGVVPAEANLFAWPTYPPVTPAPTSSIAPTFSILELEGYTFRGFGSCVDSKSDGYCCHITYDAKTIEECAIFCAETYAPHAEQKFIGIQYTEGSWGLPCTCLRDASSEYFGSDNGPIQGVDSGYFSRSTYCYSYDESFVSPVPSSRPSESTHPTGSERSGRPSTAPSLSSDPTSPVEGYVGKGECLDAFGNQYSAIRFHGPSPAFCVKHCGRIPTENQDDLVGFQHTTLFEHECLCLFGSLTVNPSDTAELRKELGLRTSASERRAGKGQVATSTLHEGAQMETSRVLLALIPSPPQLPEYEDDTMVCFKWVSFVWTYTHSA